MKILNPHRNNQKQDVFCIDRIIVFAMTFLLLAMSFLAFPAIETEAAVSPFSDEATYQADIKALFQNAYDSMGAEVDFTVEGNNLCKNLLVTDTAGNVVLFKNPDTGKDEFRTAPLTETLLNEQLMDMRPTNDNAYNRMALGSYGINCSVSYTNTSGIINVSSIKFQYMLTWRDGASSLAAKNAVIDHANVYLNSADYPKTGTEYTRLKAINNYICRAFQYDYRLFVPAEAAATIYTAYGMITDSGAIGGYKRGVCQAYAMYGYIMLKQAGFDAVIIDGNAGGGGHAWNMVRTDSNWYHVDFTWDDPVSDGNPAPYTLRQRGAGVVDETYLLRADFEISVNHAWAAVQNGYTYPRTPGVKHPNTLAMPANIPTQFNPEPTLTSIPTKVPAKPTPAKPTPTGSGLSSSINSSTSSVQTATIGTDPDDMISSITPGEQPTESDIDPIPGISAANWLKGTVIAVVVLTLLLLLAIRRFRRYE